MSFWQAIWLVIVCFAFICYLMILWSILTDLFRDHQLSGWLKAVWVVFLFFIPLLTSLVYLIARGDGMTRRSRAAHADAQQRQEEYIRNIAQPHNPTQQIADAKALLDTGTITQEEFETLKGRALV
ncbi:MAG: SHOCT domain-containing protein [Tomitella sp.]|nr:SHOCT domain-containing protein [Tomitella sp.]